MWFTKDDDGYRAWFAVQAANGTLRTGGVSGNFTATVVNPADTASTIPTVTESTTKPGIYTFLIPSSFFTTHGSGGYGVVVEIAIPAPNRVDAVFGEVLRVFDEDFDSLSTSISSIDYKGSVYIDTKNGVSGTVVGINGVVGNPVDNLADAVTLAASIGVRRYRLTGSITLTSAHDDWAFEGLAADASVNVNGQDVIDSRFSRVQLSGAIGNGPIHTDDCVLDGVTNLTGDIHTSGLINSNTLGSGTVTLYGCHSLVPGLSTPILDLDGVASLNLRAYSGGIDIRNMTAGGQNATLEFIAGQAIIGSSNTSGTLVLRGVGNLTDTSSGTTIEKNSFLHIDAIWDEIHDGTVTARTIMRRVNAMARGRITLTGASTKPAQDAVYYDESGTPVYTNRNTGDERNPL